MRLAPHLQQAARLPHRWSRKAYDEAERARRWAAGTFGCSCAGEAAAFNPSTSGGGPTTTPSWIAAGTGSNANSNPTPAYGTNASGDLFLMLVYCNAGSSSAPTGWTQQHTATDGVVTINVYTRNTRSTGSESGTVSVTASGGSPIQAVIHTFRNVATSSFVEGTSTATGGSPLSMPSVVCGGNARLAVAAMGCNSNAGISDSTGESGGDWAKATAEFTSGVGAACCIQIASMSSGGTISGGSSTTSGSRTVCAAFALIGV